MKEPTRPPRTARKSPPPPAPPPRHFSAPGQAQANTPAHIEKLSELEKRLDAVPERLAKSEARLDALEQANRDRREVGQGAMHEPPPRPTPPPPKETRDGDVPPRRTKGQPICPHCEMLITTRLADHVPLCPCRSVS